MALQVPYPSRYDRPKADESKLLHYLKESRIEGFFNDVTVGVGNECITASRAVLSCYSRYFERIFKTKKDYKHSIEIDDLDGTSVKMLIEYIYTGEITVDNDNVFDILQTAHVLGLDEVTSFCFKLLESSISCDTCFQLLTAVNDYEAESLKAELYRFIGDHFVEVSSSLNFKNLSKRDLGFCISNIDRSKAGEMLIYEAIVRWTKHDEEERRKDFPELFHMLQLNQLPSNYLLDVVAKEELVETNLTCSKLVMNTLSMLLKEKKRKEGGTKIVSIGGGKSPSKVKAVYNCTEEEVKKIPRFPLDLSSHSALQLDNVLYCIGGVEAADNAVTGKVWQLDLNENVLVWKEIDRLKNKRRFMGAAIYYDNLVVTGGGYENVSTSSAETFIKHTKKWNLISPLQQQRSAHSLVACEGCLYALGGFCGGNSLSSVERTSSLHGNWEYVEPMQTPRKWLAAVNCKDSIYAIGGQSGRDGTELKSVEKFDPESNTWTYVCEMTTCRAGHSACVLQGKIFVAGGLNKTGSVVKRIECYDPTNDEWTVIGRTKDDLLHHTLVVL